MLESSELLQLCQRFLDGADGSRSILSRVTKEEMDVIVRTLPSLVLDASQWSRGWLTVSPTTVIPITLQACVQLGHLRYDAMLTRVKSGLWMYALDDLLDNGGLREGDLQDVLRECFDIACGSLAGKRDELTYGLGELAGALHDICEQLGAQRNHTAVYPYWLVSMTRVFEGMAYEYWLGEQFRNCDTRIGASLPEYMHFARYSIFVPNLWLAGLMSEPDDSLRLALASLSRLAEQCGVVVRLANDLGTCDRETKEGRINSVVLRARDLLSNAEAKDYASAVLQAKKDILQQIRAEQVELQRLAQCVHTHSGIERGFVRGADFAVSLYLDRDIREWAD